MTPVPGAAVVMITHDRCPEADLALTRLERLPERPQIVVVDNGSTDGTADMVRDRHPAARLIRLPGNLGAVGRNIGVRAVETPYVAFCDDDTWYEPGALTAAVELLEKYPEVAVVTASIIVEPAGELDPICDEMAATPLRTDADLPGHSLISFLAGVSVVRRSAFLQAGGFSDKLWLGGEEELLASDLMRAGWELLYVPRIVAHHQASTARDPHLRRRHGIRNTLWFTWLRRPMPSAVRRTLRLLRQLPADRTTALALADALRGLWWVRQHRQIVPPHVETRYLAIDAAQLSSKARRYVS